MVVAPGAPATRILQPRAPTAAVADVRVEVVLLHRRRAGAILASASAAAPNIGAPVVVVVVDGVVALWRVLRAFEEGEARAPVQGVPDDLAERDAEEEA